MRFLHTSDWQLGMPVSRFGLAGQAIHHARRQAFERVVARAAEHRAEFIVLAGDLFDAETVAPEVLETAVRILGQTPLPVYVLPGNHDPGRSRALWQSRAWEAAPNVHIMLKPVPLSVGTATLYPCPVMQKSPTGDPTAWIPTRGTGDGVRIGVAHGPYAGRGDIGDPPGAIPSRAAQLRELDYLALGDWHSHAVYDNINVYCGTPELTRSDETNPGNVLLVDIAGPGGSCQITPLRVGGLRWVRLSRELRDDSSVDTLYSELATAGSECLLDLYLSGEVSPSIVERVANEVIPRAQERFLHARIDDTQLRLSPTDGELGQMCSGPVLRLVVERLRQRAAGDDQEDAALSREALRIMYRASRR